MPTLDLKVQTIGPQLYDFGAGTPYPWYTSVVGETIPHKAVDDSHTTTHDGDATYIVMPAGGAVTFYMFKGSEHWTVSSITLRAVMSAALPNLDINLILARNDDFNDVQLIGTTTAAQANTYTLATADAPLNPWTGLAWTAAELRDCTVGVFPNLGLAGLGEPCRLTLISGQVTYTGPIDWVTG